MKPVYQTRYDAEGNCFEASIASLLDLEISDVPDLQACADSNWMEKLNKWLRENNMNYFEARISSNEVDNFFKDKDFYHTMIGFTKRSSEIRHCVIGYKGKIVHDPHPSNIGIIINETVDIGVIVKRCE